MKKILIVDDHKLIFDGLCGTLQGEFSLDYAPTVQQAANQFDLNDYFAVLLDVAIGQDKGFELLSSIPEKVYVFFLSMHKSSSYIKMARDFGCHGYFLKDEPLDLLYRALRTPLEQQFWMSKTVREELENSMVYEGSLYDTLTPREQQVFAMLAEDLNYKEVASRLGLSAKTVNNHRDHLMKKLKVDSQVGLVKEALRLGIVTID